MAEYVGVIPLSRARASNSISLLWVLNSRGATINFLNIATFCFEQFARSLPLEDHCGSSPLCLNSSASRL